MFLKASGNRNSSFGDPPLSLSVCVYVRVREWKSWPAFTPSCHIPRGSPLAGWCKIDRGGVYYFVEWFHVDSTPQHSFLLILTTSLHSNPSPYLFDERYFFSVVQAFKLSRTKNFDWTPIARLLCNRCNNEQFFISSVYILWLQCIYFISNELLSFTRSLLLCVDWFLCIPPLRCTRV